MKKITLGVPIVILFLITYTRICSAQGSTTFLSNLGQTPDGSNPVGSNSWLAASFFTGANSGGYSLNSVQLGLADATGSPAGFAVMIYASADIFGGTRPTGSIGTLSGSANPATAGTYTFTPASGLVLSPSTEYFIVLTGGTAIANGAFVWDFENASDYQPSNGWLGGVTFSSANGSTLSWLPVGNAPSYENSQFAITATAAPEPGVVGLIFAGGMLFGLRKLVQGPKSKVQS